MYMAISMDSFSKEFLQGMCEEYIALLLKVHGNIHGSFVLLNNFYITQMLQVHGNFHGSSWSIIFLIRHIVIGYMEISTHGPFC